ncbi:30S ribosomal protein S8 [Candidatus Woesearchaeota archaeon]|nr:30S ribosomal protein S8 [Candidatus Woesearchaeota archaeon]
MTMNDLLSNVLSHISNEDSMGRTFINVRYNSKLIRNVLLILQDNKYIGSFKEIDDNRGGRLKINLLGKINKCGAIKPRFNVKVEDYEKFEKRFLPAYGFGLLIVSTNKGVMTQEEAKKKGIGGKLLAFVY